MICSLTDRRNLGFICRSAVRFLDMTISRGMGCFLACFRVREHNRRTQHPQNSARSQGAAGSQHRLSSLFLSEGEEDSPCKDAVNSGFGSPRIDKGLKDEAKLLKACGTIPETPVEIRKASKKLIQNTDIEPPEIHSRLPKESVEKHPDQSCTPVKLSKQCGVDFHSPNHSSMSCISNAKTSGRISTSSIDSSGGMSVKTPIKVDENQNDNNSTVESPQTTVTDVKCRSKTVRFECNVDLPPSGSSSSENGSQGSKKCKTPANRSVTGSSPNPTPLKLSDEMQTPGTVYPVNSEDVANKKVWVRSQYVYSVSSLIENASQWKVPKKDDSNSHLLSDGLGDNLKQPKSETPMSKANLNESSVVKESTSEDENNQNIGVVSAEKPHFGRSPDDRPIIGLVATHWNDNENSRVPPKWWDGNGIPNSTNKYKEDQKVSWHATPFEERLEKALSDESFIFQRKPICGRPIVFPEDEENDTAVSQQKV